MIFFSSDLLSSFGKRQLHLVETHYDHFKINLLVRVVAEAIILSRFYHSSRTL